MSFVDITVVRHGQTVANARNQIQGQMDFPLDDLGVRQGMLLAERLRHETFDLICSSDLKRAVDTAKLIGGTTGNIGLYPELREWNLGEWQGLPMEQVKIKFPEELEGFMFDHDIINITGGESKAEFYQRIGDFLENFTVANPDKKVLMVTHTGVLRAMFKHILGTTKRFQRQPRSDNASYNRMVWNDGFWQLFCWNDTSHLHGESVHNCGY